MAKRKNRRAPPWGDMLGGAIERMFPRDHPRFGTDAEGDALAEQYRKMVRLKEYFGIEGKTGWYQLALALARELDFSLEIVDLPPLPDGKTVKKWRGAEGKLLIREIEALRAKYPASSDKSLLATHQELCARYRDMSLGELERRYYEARKYHTAKQGKK